jgi:hypothetical protein
MKPEWRTRTVVGICRKMLDERDFAALPILADALEDAGCDDTETLTVCRQLGLTPLQAERLTNLVYSEETAAAVHALEEFAKEINYGEEDEYYPGFGYKDMIRVGHEAAKEGECYFNTTRGPEFLWNEYNRRDFFRNWSLVTGIQVSEERQDEMAFRCSC